MFFLFAFSYLSHLIFVIIFILDFSLPLHLSFLLFILLDLNKLLPILLIIPFSIILPILIVIIPTPIPLISLWLSLLSLYIPPNLNPLNLTLMNGRIEVHNFDLALKLVALDPTTWTLASLVADEDACVHNALLLWLLELFV